MSKCGGCFTFLATGLLPVCDQCINPSGLLWLFLNSAENPFITRILDGLVDSALGQHETLKPPSGGFFI